MRKKIFTMIMFVGLVVLSMGVASNVLDAAGGGFSDCWCFNEAAAESLCESVCQGLTGTGCWQAVPTNGWCENYLMNNNCAFNFWAYCHNGNQYRRTVTQPGCPDCSQ